jgi:dTDP-4-dehydrorhamnose reductase
MQRLLITGGTGLLGLNWAVAQRHERDIILGIHRRHLAPAGVRTAELPLDDRAAFEAKVRDLDPDVIVHAAALANVDECEKDPAAAQFANVDLAANAAAAAAACGKKLIHISSDQLFDGKSSMLSEDAPVCPLNEYGRSKARAEEQVAALCPKALIVRTNFFGHGSGGRTSFSDWILGQLRTENRPSLFTDVFFTPILIEPLARICMELAERGVSGIYNVVGDERLSKFEFGQKLARVFKLPVDLLKPGSVEDAHLAANRPHDMSLSNQKLRGVIGRSPGTVMDFLARLREQERDARAEALQ